jgi:ATP-binding cassette subfamily B (MDR/TAP) protein 1
MAAAIIAGAG